MTGEWSKGKSGRRFASDPARAWGVGFDDGSVPDDLKSCTFHVRAVRGGLGGADAPGR